MSLPILRRFSPNIPVFAISTAVIACTLLTSRASAQIIFTDNFNAETPGLTKISLTNWTVTNASNPVSSGGSVDAIGTGPNGNSFDFGFYPGNGYYIDLDGSTNVAAVFTTKTAFNLAAGSYTLSFDLGKNGSSTESMTVSVGGVFSQVISDSLTYSALSPQTFNFMVSSATTGAITFNHSGTDNQGYIIDNVSLVRQRLSTDAPEPGTLSLLAALPATVGLLRLRRRK